MNLLTDIIRDVARKMNIEINDEEAIKIQRSTMNSISQNLLWIKQEQLEKEEFPWMQKPKRT